MQNADLEQDDQQEKCDGQNREECRRERQIVKLARMHFQALRG
jgi:hypothetical protein